MSVRVINPDIAIRRIKHITKLIRTGEYNELETASCEHIPSTMADIPFKANLPIECFPRVTLQNIMNYPFYRFHNQDIYILGDNHGYN